MTLLEASRRKVFLIPLLFAAALVSTVAFFPAIQPEGRLRLIEIWSLRAASLFAAIVALFLAGFSLPGDFEEKRIYLLVTKPVSKVTVFLGKHLGFLLLLAIFLGIMGVITLAFIRVVQFSSRDSFPALAAYPRVNAAKFSHEGAMPSQANPSQLLLSGPRENALIWRFKGLKRSDFPKQIRVSLKLNLFSPDDVFRASGNVRIIARDSSGRRQGEERRLLQTHEETEVGFPPSILGEDGSLEIVVRRGDADGVIRGDAGAVALFEKSGSFELNYLRGMGLSFLESALVLTLTLTASTFLSAPLSILLGILLYLVGTSHGYVLEGTRDIKKSIQESHAHEEEPRPEELPEWVLKPATAISGVVLAMVPDFENFNFSRWLLKDRAVAWREIGTAAFYAFQRIAVLALVGMTVMMAKDFG